MRKINKGKLFKFLCLILYLGCVGVLIVESAMDGAASSSQSNAVGGAIADAFNDISGDQTVAVLPTSVTISNKITDAKIGETYDLTSSVLPENATFKALNYTSSNPKVATVDGSGHVSFISIGEVTITVSNKDYPDLKDSVTINITNVEAESITSSIDAKVTSNGEYELYIGHQYPINTVFTPENTTIKSLRYEVSDSSYLTVNDNGVITPTKYSANSTIEIKVIHNNLEQILKVHVEYEHKVELEHINIEVPSICVKQTVTPKVTFSPNDATFKDYKLISSDSSILQVSGKKLVGKKAGTVTITCQSTIYDYIKTEVTVTVAPQPEIDLNKTTVTLTKSLYVGNTAKVSVKINPTYGVYTKIEYASSDPSVATVSSGKVTAVGVGECNIICKIYTSASSKEFTLPLKVTQKVDIATEDYTLNTDKVIIYCDTPTKLSDLIYVSSWLPAKPSNTSLSYTLSDSSFGSITNGVITLIKAGTTTIDVTHNDSGITKSVQIVSLFDFEIQVEASVIDVDISVDQKIKFWISDNQQGEKTQFYHFTIDDTILSLQEEDGYYLLTALHEGVATLKVYPYVEEEDYFDYSHEVVFNISNIYTEELNYHVINSKNNQVVLDDKQNGYSMTLIDEFFIETILSSNTTTYNLEYSSSDNNILKVEPNGKIIPVEPGTATLYIKETHSGLIRELKFNCYNFIKIDSENSYILKGTTLTYNEDENKYFVNNGNSLKLTINFDELSTYKKVIYSSSDEKIATVGEDGTITPNKKGTVVITATCDDGSLTPITLEITLEVKPLDLINDLSDFFYKIRKGLGHFGAFFVLGIFSTLTWLLYLNKKKMIISVPVNIILGFGVAALTEFIQYFVPGRYGCLSDVLLDFSGFIISAILLSVILIIREIVIYVKHKKQNLDIA